MALFYENNIRMHANVQTMVFTNDGWWVYKILQNYWQLLMQYKLTIPVSFLVHNLPGTFLYLNHLLMADTYSI